jgi:hypothetical protein
VRDRVFALMGLVSEEARFYPDYSMALQDILLTLMRSQITPIVYCPSEGFKTVTIRSGLLRFISDNIENCAQEWYWILDQGQQEIDPKAVRSFLLKEIRSLLSESPYLADLEAKYYLKTRLIRLFTTLRDGPTILARLSLRLLLPDRNSMLWHYWHRKKKPRYLTIDDLVNR